MSSPLLRFGKLPRVVPLSVSYLVVGGGGGGGEHGTAQNGQAGGSGVVVLRIPDSFSANFSAGVVYQLNTSGGYKTYTVTSAANGQTVTFSS